MENFLWELIIHSICGEQYNSHTENGNVGVFFLLLLVNAATAYVFFLIGQRFRSLPNLVQIDEGVQYVAPPGTSSSRLVTRQESRHISNT